MTGNEPQQGVGARELELAERCEAATGPDRELDAMIAVATDWRWDDWEEGESTARGQAEKHGLDWLVGRAKDGMASMWRHMPRYTASLDAAVTLVPDGWEYTAKQEGPRHIWAMHKRRVEVANAATPALALCGAALRARAAQEPPQ